VGAALIVALLSVPLAYAAGDAGVFIRKDGEMKESDPFSLSD
jgi:hypothetical protein